MKNFNLIEWLQTDSHGKQSATRDHHGTKSRELPDNPRLYRYPCATLALPLRYVAMIFAVLVMSMANIGMAWGTKASWTSPNQSSLPTSLDDGKISLAWSKNSSSSQTSVIYNGGKSSAVARFFSDGSTLTIGTTSSYKIDSIIITIGNKSNSPAGFKTGGVTTGWSTFNTSGTNKYTVATPSAGNSFVITIYKTGGTLTNGRIDITGIDVYYVSAGGATSHSVSAVTSTGTNTYGTVSAAASSVAEGGTTTITATPAAGYRVTNWAVSGTGASISPTGASNSTTTTLTMGTANATVTVTFGAIPTHTITYTNTKSMDNSANPTSYYEGVGVASFTKLRHAVGYDFTGWSPSSISSSATTNQTIDAQWTARAAAAGTGTLTYALAFESSIITTSSITRNNGALYDATNISTANTSFVSGGEAPGNGCSGKLATTSSKSGSNYVELTFKIADGYTFTPSGVSIRANAVSNNKTLEVELKDNAASPHTKSVTATLTAGSTSGGVTYNLDFSSSPVTLEGTVTLKIYVYGSDGATKGWRIGPSVIVNGTVASAAPTCTAPSSVGITGTNKYLGGQTISLTATPVGGSGTATYQWQKEINSVWTNLENGGNISGATSANLQISSCGHGNSGQYRCVVSTGATCSTNSSAYGVHVFSIYGKYYSGEYSHNEITWTSGTTGTATIHLNASSTYLFKVWSNDGYYYGNGSNNYIIQPVNWDCGTGNDEMRLLTGPEGDYTFTVNIEHGLDGSPYVNVQVGYPSVSHPSTGYMYITKWWDHCYVHYWEGTNNALSPWGYDPEINSDRYVEICGTNYWYFPVIDTYNKLIAKDAAGDPSNTTGDQVSTSNGGRYITHDGSWGWHDFSTYTITYAANGGGGSMTATSGICPDANQAITSNAFTAPSGCASFGHWTANVNVKVGGNTITAGDPIANGATIQNINSNITLTAVWKLATPTITDNGDNTFSISGSMAGSSYYYTTNDGTPTTSSSLYSSAVDFSAGEANITAKAIAHKDGYVDSDVASQACTYHAPAGDEHVYYYKDATHYVSSSYKNPEGGTPSGTDNVALTTPWTIRNNTFMTGLTSVVATAARYDNKGSHMNAYIKLRQTDGGKIVFTIASGYTATIKIKMGGYSGANTNLTMKLNDSGDNITYSGTMSGAGTTEDDYAQLTYADLAAGAYTLKPTSGSLYISQIDIETEAVAACTAAPTVTAGSNSSVGSTTATVSCASGISSLGTGGCTITEYGFVIGTSADPVIGGSGVTKHVVGTTYTTTGTSFSKNLTGLTASTTYYVRPYATNGYGTGYGTQTSFTTAAAGPEALIHWIVTVDASTWSLNGSPTTTDGTNITSISSSIDAASSPSTGASGTTAKVALAAASDNVSNAASFTFTVNSAKKVEPERVTCQVFNVGGSSGGQLSYKAQLSDNNGHIYYSTNTVVPASEATLTDATFTFASDLVLTGNVTIKVYGWKSGSAGSAFRMGADVKLFGEVQNAADYTVTHTLSNITKSDGATSVKEGNNYTATYAGAGGYTLPSTIGVTIGGSPATAGTDYTWTQGTGVVSIPGNKVTGNIVITVTGVAVVNYSITYHCNGAESGCPSNVAATTNLPSPLPTGLTKDGYDFGGWFTDSECTVAAVAGAALTGNTDLYAKWTVHSASECITITNFETSQHNNSSSKPDSQGKYIYGYKGTVDAEHAVTITTASTNNKGQNSNADMLVYYGTSIYIYADNTTTGGTPATFSNVTSVSLKIKNKHATKYSTLTIKVGSTTIANAVSLSDANNSTYTTFTYDNLAQLSGKIEIHNGGSGSSDYNFFIDDIEICTASMSTCTTPTLPTATLSNQTVCEGRDIAAWDATPTNASAITDAGQSISYSWKKKGNDTELATTATFDLGSSAAESQAGTYVVTVTVSKAGYTSSTANKEVELSVNATVEISGVTQSPATVYAGNSVTLTATANVSATWQWYTCTNAEGDGEASISGATSAAYAFTAPASAGTYYYKVKATGPCGGVATEVYALTVSTASAGCNNMVIFDGSTMSSHPSATATGSESNSGASWANVGTAESSSNCSYSYGGKTYTKGWKFVSGATTSTTKYIQIDIPSGYTGDLFMAGYITSSSRSMYIATTPTGSRVTTYAYLTPASTNVLETTSATLTAGTYYVCATDGFFIAELSLNICSTVTCTDPAVTASVSKSNVCAGDDEGITFTASDAHASATLQWQKQNGSTWDDISGATAATYTIATVEASHAGKYRVVASHDCDRISNELTLTVASTPVFGDLGSAREVETGGSLSITNVEATNTTGYKWYKSANATYDSGSDEQVGTSKNLMLPVSETAGSTFYLFCVASNACTSTVSGAITVNVIAATEKDCAVGASNGENFTTAKTGSVSSGTYNGQTELHMNSNNKYIYYIAASGYHFETATVNCCAGDATALTGAAYSYSTDGGETWTDADLPGAMTNQYSDHVVNLSADVNAFRVGRVLGDHGVGSNTLYVHEVCFTYVADCNATTITVSDATPSYDLAAGGDFTAPTCTVKQGSTTLSPQPALRYSSFNEDIATVDPSTGDVDFTGMAGSVMIMASYDGDGTYCESSATYTITVTCGSESAPKIVAGSGTNLSGCNSEVNLVVKDQSGNDFASGSYQWYRDGEEIEDATSASYTAERTGTYTVSHTGACTQMSTNSAVVTSESFDPSVERLAPFQYYHANKTYTEQMKMRHLFAVTSGGDYEGKRYYMTATRNGAPLDITTSTAFSVRTSNDNRVDSVMIDLNRLNGKFNAGDEIVLTCAAIADCGTISAVTEDIEIHVIDNTPTLALICSGTNKSAGTRKTGELTVGGDFLTGYNKADLCEQTGKTSFDASTEWGLYTKLKEHYIVTPVNGYAVFNKLNYEPFDILLLTDYPKASKSTEAALILDDMYELCDYRPMLSFKAHMVQPADQLDGRESHWMRKGFTTLPVVPEQTRQRLNIVCYAHPMFKDIKGEGVARDYDDNSQIVYTMLSGPGYESSKGMQGFHLAAAENFVTIGLIHNDATPTDNYEGSGDVKWTPGSKDEMLVAAAERQANLEARFILFSINCGAQSKLTEQGHTVVLECLEYLLNDATIKENIADCSLTFDNKTGDGKWSTGGNWAPDYTEIPGMYNSARIAAPATVDIQHAKALSVRILEGGSIDIPAGSGLEVKSTVRHQGEDDEIYPTEENDIHVGSEETGNGTLIFNNNSGDTKARVDMYSKASIIDGVKNYQYMGVPCVNINALYNYYGSWIYSWSDKGGSYGWKKVANGGIVTAWTGYCITQESAVTHAISGTLAATGTVDINVPAGENMVVGNSWTAPIDIKAFTDDDFENLTGNVYFFNTGVDKTGEGTVNPSPTGATRWAAGSYSSVPIHAASYTDTDDHIPSLQGFFVKSSGSAGTLHLDYDRHVRGTTRDNILSGPMHAPKRAQATDTDEPVVLKIKVSGENYDDKLVLLGREDFSEGFDNGWDGDKWDGNESALYLYTTDSEGTENSVSAVPELEGTVIGFRAGEDDEYTMYFDYLNGDEKLYLWDTETGDYTVIKTGYAYAFTTADKEKHARFIITRSNGQDVSTDITSTASQGEGAKAKKLLIGNNMYIMVDGRLFDATGKVVK